MSAIAGPHAIATVMLHFSNAIVIHAAVCNALNGTVPICIRSLNTPRVQER